MAALWQDLRFGFRTLLKSPGFTLVAVLTLALGIGANTAMFSVLNGVLLRALPFRDAGRLVILNETNARGNISVNYVDFLDWRQQSHSFSGLAAVHNRGFNLAGTDRPERIAGLAVSSNLLSLLGVRPILGRDLLPGEEKPGTAPVALLSYKLWQSHFGGAPGALGRVITLDGVAFTIVGVLPASFSFTDTSDIVVPIGVYAGGLMERGEHGDMVVAGRLAPGVTLRAASSEMSAIAARMAAQYPKTNRGDGVALQPLRNSLVGDARTPVLVLFGAVTFVLLIACVNVANLFLVRGAARSREIAVRLAFGAGRGRIVRQMLTESFLLAILGGAAGLLCAAWGIAGLGRILPMDMIDPASIQPDRTVFLFASVLVFLVAGISGLFPALRAARPEIQETLKEGGRGSTSGAARQRLHGFLAIAETALALVLLVGAGLMMKSLYLLMRVDPGFRPDRVLTMEVNLSRVRYPNDAVQSAFWSQAVDRIRAIPGVEAAAVGTVIPLTFNHSRGDITIEGRPIPNYGEFPHPDEHVVSSGYCTALGIPLLRGRVFDDSDREGTPPTALVNETLARKFWPAGDAVGKRFLLGHPGPDNKWVTIVGVVGDTRLYGLASPPRLEIYLPYRQQPTSDMNFVIRAAADPAALTTAVRAAIAGVDKDEPPFAIAPMRQLVEQSAPLRRLTLIGLAIFSALALLLAAIGVYGVISYSVARRTQEIGIRMAIGARPASVLWMVLREGLRLAAAGAAIGTVIAFGASRAIATLLYGVTPADPLTYAVVATVLLAVAALACYVPARRAMNCDPMTALRSE